MWHPDDPWPSPRKGGVAHPNWGGYVRLWVQAGLAPGNTFHLGPHAFDKLDAGNVMGGAPTGDDLPPDPVTVDALWVDLTCDTMDVTIAGGASSEQGILSKSDASTCQVTLYDPDRRYDPFNRGGPYQYQGRSRLVPGTPVVVFAEVVEPISSTVTTHFLFSGTADVWSEDFAPFQGARQAHLTATDETKRWAKYNQTEQPPEGAGDTIEDRVNRLVTYFAWPGPVEHDVSSTATLQETTLAQSGWEMLNRALNDELGYIYFTPDGTLRWVRREAWDTLSPPVITVGCSNVIAHDVVTAVTPAVIDSQLRNRISAARNGGTAQEAVSTASIGAYGEYDYKQTDLSLETDLQVADWANVLLTRYAFPQQSLDNATLVPGADPESWKVWKAVLGIRYVTDLVQLVWQPHDLPEATAVNQLSRVVGHSYRITTGEWEVTWSLVGANALEQTGVIFHLGPHDNDLLDSGFLMG